MATQNKLEIIADSGSQNITLIREIDAPVDRVFQAYADPELVVQWLGPRRLTMKIEQWQVVSGGGYAYAHIDQDGAEFGFRDMFHTVRPNEQIIQTFEYLGFPGSVSIEVMTFEEAGPGRTRIVSTATYPSTETREQMLQSGMEVGVSEGYERLAELLA